MLPSGFPLVSLVREDIRSRILPFVIPVMTEQAFIALMGLVNAAMAGSAGTRVAAAVGLVNAITNVIISILSALALGGTVVVARHLGAGDSDKARAGAWQAVLVSVAGAIVAGLTVAVFARPVVDLLYGTADSGVRGAAAGYLAITALGYPFLALSLASSGTLRGAGDSRSPMYVNVLMNVVNVLAGRVFIFGVLAGGRTIVPPLGAAGAALAITIARGFGAAAFTRLLLSGRSRLCLRGLPSYGPDREHLRIIFSVGLPASVESLLFNGGKLITQTFLAGLGEVAMTADYLATSLAALVQVPASSLSMTAAPLVGQSLGRNDPEGARRVIVSSLLLGAAVLAAVTAPLFVLAPRLVAMSTSRQDVISLASTLLRFFVLLQPLFWGPSFLISSGLRGAGDGRYTMWVSIFSMWTFRVGLGWVFSHPLGLGVPGLWFAMGADWIVRSWFFLRRLFDDGWLPEARGFTRRNPRSRAKGARPPAAKVDPDPGEG